MREFRFVITPFCNYKCFFCHSESVAKEIALLLRPSDYGFMAQAAKDILGWNTCTITGGEPLISPIFLDTSERLARIGIKTTVVSNASLLARPKEMLVNIDQLNVSLHTMSSETYKKIIQFHYPLHAILNTLVMTRTQLPNLKIHINYTVIKDLNDSSKEIEELLRFARSIQATAKFIDLSSTDDKVATYADDITARLESMGFEVYAVTAWQIFLARGSEKVIVTKCPFNGKYKDVEVRDIFVESDGTLFTSYSGKKRCNVLSEIRNGDEQGFIKKAISLIP